MSAIAEYIPGMGGDPYETLVDGLHDVLGDADALALLPYDDGTFFMKAAYFDKELIGGIGGYETEDGDKIAVDGQGEAKRDLFGVPVILAVDPTEHAAAVDPIKALIAHKNDIGEWIRVDREGTVVQVGPAIKPAPVIIEADSVDQAFEEGTLVELLNLLWGENWDPEEYEEEELEEWVEENEAEIREKIERWLAQSIEPSVSAEGVVGDGGMVGQHAQRHEIPFEQALKELAREGDVTKVYDIAPPAGISLDEFGEVQLDAATHIAVDQSKAADLLPTTWDTVELNTALDKARMEEYEEGKFMKYLTYGIIIGAIGTITVVIVMFLLMSISGGVF